MLVSLAKEVLIIYEEVGRIPITLLFRLLTTAN